jgi:DNA-binding CsgD family transcriptional regulator
VAAVAGRTVDHRLLAAVSELPERALVGALRDAVANHVLVSDGLRYAFRHALLRDAVYAELVAGQRAPLHAALAAALSGHPELAEARATSEAEIAHHWGAAGIDEPALAAAVRAAAQAERMYAVADARRHYEQALELWERVADPAQLAGLARWELLRRAADAVWLAGDEQGAVALARAALAEPDLVAEAQIHGRLATYLWGSGQSEEALRAARSAVELLPADPPTADRARALTAEGRMLVMRSQALEARGRCAEALAVARAAGARDVEGEALNYLGSALAFLGDGEGAIAHLREAVAILRAHAGGARGCPEYENLGEILADTGRHGEGLAVAREGIAVARELGVERSYGVVLRGRAALCALALADVTEVERLTAEAFDLGGESFFAFNALEAAGRCALLRGDLAAAERHLQVAEAMGERFGDVMWIGPIAAARAELELWRRQPAQAVDIVAGVLAHARERESLHHTAELHAHGARAYADLAQAAGALRDAGRRELAAESAAALRDRLGERMAGSFPLGEPPARTRADAALCAAEVTRAHALADPEPWRAAVAACEAFGHRPRSAYARWRLAEALLEQGDRDGAAAALLAAMELDHAPLAGELAALARRARIPLARAPHHNELGLTRREVDVLRLLADGLTNREIAARLYISEKTAEHHVSRILGKLGVRTRGAASSVAHRLGVEALGPPR